MTNYVIYRGFLIALALMVGAPAFARISSNDLTSRQFNRICDYIPQCVTDRAQLLNEKANQNKRYLEALATPMEKEVPDAEMQKALQTKMQTVKVLK